MRILIADDHAIVREGLKRIFATTADMEVSGEAADGAALLDLLRREGGDVVLLDIALGRDSGLDLLRQIKKLYPRLPVLVLSMYGENELAVRSLKMGASAYLTKETVPENLVMAVRKVAAGGTYVSPALAEDLARQLRVAGDRPHERLSNREFQVLCRLAEGKTVTEIAREFGISVKTVSTHRRHILDKMRMRSTPQLIRYAIENSLIDPVPE